MSFDEFFNVSYFYLFQDGQENNWFHSRSKLWWLPKHPCRCNPFLCFGEWCKCFCYFYALLKNVCMVATRDAMYSAPFQQLYITQLVVFNL